MDIAFIAQVMSSSSNANVSA